MFIDYVSIKSFHATSVFPVGIYLLKVNNGNTRTSMKYVQS